MASFKQRKVLRGLSSSILKDRLFLMAGTSPHSMFDTSSFIQKLLKRKPESKYAVRPLYTADIITEERPWRKQIQAATKAATSYTLQPICQRKATKTYNMQHAPPPQQQPSPTATASASLLTTASSLSDSAIFSSDHLSCYQRQQSPPSSPRRKRPLSSDVLLKLMDQRLFKQQQLEQQKIAEALLSTKRPVPTMTKSLSSSTSSSSHSRLNKLFNQNKPLLSPSLSITLPSRRNSQNSQNHQKNNKPSTSRPAISLQNKRSFPSSSSSNHSAQLSSSSSSSSNSSSSSSKAAMAAFTAMPYVLSQDNEEQDRMVAQHYLLRTAFGSDFMSPIKSQLQKGIVVLDIGCGPGTWTMEMSTAFPKSTFIGIDQHAYFPKDIKPRNCHFRTCASLAVERQQRQQQQLHKQSQLKENSGHYDAASVEDDDDLDENSIVLPFPDSSIDYIYQRDMNWALMGQTWQPLLLECLRILKPGGWIEFVEPDLETQNSLESEYLMNDQLITGLTLRQQDPYAVHRLPTMLAISGFNRVDDFGESLPLGWGLSHSKSSSKTNSIDMENTSIKEEDQNSNKQQQKDEPTSSEFARAVSSQYLFFLKSLKPWLSTVMNLTSAEYDEYIQDLPKEWKRAGTYLNWHTIIAQKPYL